MSGGVSKNVQQAFRRHVVGIGAVGDAGLVHELTHRQCAENLDDKFYVRQSRVASAVPLRSVVSVAPQPLLTCRSGPPYRREDMLYYIFKLR